MTIQLGGDVHFYSRENDELREGINDLFNIYEANADLGSNQAGLVKYILVNDIPLSLMFMILISSMKIED